MSIESSGKPDAWKLARPVWGWGRGETPRPTPRAVAATVRRRPMDLHRTRMRTSPNRINRNRGTGPALLWICLTVGCSGRACRSPAEAVQFEIGGGQTVVNCLVWLPERNSGTVKQWPLVLFLHGAGECGDDLEVVKKYGLPKRLEDGRRFPFILVAPQSSAPDGTRRSSRACWTRCWRIMLWTGSEFTSPD